MTFNVLFYESRPCQQLRCRRSGSAGRTQRGGGFPSPTSRPARAVRRDGREPPRPKSAGLGRGGLACQSSPESTYDWDRTNTRVCPMTTRWWTALGPSSVPETYFYVTHILTRWRKGREKRALNLRPCAAVYSIERLGGRGRGAPDPSRSVPDEVKASRKKTSDLRKPMVPKFHVKGFRLSDYL